MEKLSAILLFIALFVGLCIMWAFGIEMEDDEDNDDDAIEFS